MINNVGENIARSATKMDLSAVVHDRHMDQQKTEQIKQARPIEDSESGKKMESKTAQDETSNFLLEEKKVVFEKYNKDGDVILRIPPSYVPVDEMA